MYVSNINIADVLMPQMPQICRGGNLNCKYDVCVLLLMRGYTQCSLVTEYRNVTIL